MLYANSKKYRSKKVVQESLVFSIMRVCCSLEMKVLGNTLKIKVTSHNIKRVQDLPN